MPKIKLETDMKFGKYKGKNFKYIIDNDMNYFVYVYYNNQLTNMNFIKQVYIYIDKLGYNLEKMVEEFHYEYFSRN